MRTIGTALTVILATGTAAAQQRDGSPPRDDGDTIATPNEVKGGAIQQGDCRVRRRGGRRNVAAATAGATSSAKSTG